MMQRFSDLYGMYIPEDFDAVIEWLAYRGLISELVTIIR